MLSKNASLITVSEVCFINVLLATIGLLKPTVQLSACIVQNRLRKCLFF